MRCLIEIAWLGEVSADCVLEFWRCSKNLNMYWGSACSWRTLRAICICRWYFLRGTG